MFNRSISTSLISREGMAMPTIKDKKKDKKPTVKKGSKPLGDPVDVKGIAGGKEDCCHSMGSDPKSSRF